MDNEAKAVVGLFRAGHRAGVAAALRSLFVHTQTHPHQFHALDTRKIHDITQLNE